MPLSKTSDEIHRRALDAFVGRLCDEAFTVWVVKRGS
jgi:hypothetical protein